MRKICLTMMMFCMLFASPVSAQQPNTGGNQCKVCQGFSSIFGQYPYNQGCCRKATSGGGQCEVTLRCVTYDPWSGGINNCVMYACDNCRTYGSCVAVVVIT